MNDSVTFVTIKWGVKYAPNYVNILHDMVRRNLPQHFQFSFVCFTDNTTGLLSAIETRPLPPGLTGWWNKLYLFKQGVFAEGERIFFLDLDTAITGDLSGFAAYNGVFAILRDFYRPNGLGSGVMLWRGGFGHDIWQAYEDAGRPDMSGGDQAWIERCKPPADILQDLFPSMIVSFKDKALIALPPSARIVCFHGEPRPHQVKNGWVEDVWRIGGKTPSGGTGELQPVENVRHALTLPFPWLDTQIPTDVGRRVSIIGGGASVADLTEEIRQRRQEGHVIWALNGAFQWLAKAGIEPDAQIIFAPDKNRAEYVPEDTRAMLFYASQCDPDVFTAAERVSKQVVMWHSLMDGIRDLIAPRSAVLISCGGTTGLKAIGLALALGYGDIHLYGFDSSFPGDVGTEQIEVNVGGHLFTSTPRLAQQVSDFRLIRRSLMTKNVKLTVHGEGLLPYLTRKLERLKAV